MGPTTTHLLSRKVSGIKMNKMISLKNDDDDGIRNPFFFVKFNILESQNKSGKAAGCMEDGQAA